MGPSGITILTLILISITLGFLVWFTTRCVSILLSKRLGLPAPKNPAYGDPILTLNSRSYRIFHIIILGTLFGALLLVPLFSWRSARYGLWPTLAILVLYIISMGYSIKKGDTKWIKS